MTVRLLAKGAISQLSFLAPNIVYRLAHCPLLKAMCQPIILLILNELYCVCL